MIPRARTSGLEVVAHAEGLLLRDTASNREHTLHPLTAFVWQHADGARGVPELARLATSALGDFVSDEQVWAAVDVLTGAQLMESRVAPPAGVQRLGRRDLLRSVAVGSAAAAAIGAVSVRTADAAPGEEAAKLAQKQESLRKVAQEDARKIAEQQRAEEAAKRAAQESRNKVEQQAKENAQKQSQEQDVKQQQEQQAKKQAAREQETKQAQEEKSKSQNPFAELELTDDWANLGEGFAPLSWERRGSHVSLLGLIEFIGEPEFSEPPDPNLEQSLAATVDADPPDPDSDDFEIETMLLGTLPAGARPPQTLVFSVASDTLIGTSEVHITADGEILLVLDDENDDQLDDAAGIKSPEGDANRCRRRLLRRRRQKLRRQLRQRRRMLRRRARQARRRCDGQEVFLTGPSEISLAGITFRVK